MPASTRHCRSSSKVAGSRLSAMRTSCLASWQSPSSSVQCRHSLRSYSGIPAGTSATVMTRVALDVEVGVGAAVVGSGVGVGAAVAGSGAGVGGGVVGMGVGLGATVVGAGAGVGVSIPGPGPGSIPHSRPAAKRAVSSPTSSAAIASVVAAAISLGPPKAAMTHTIPSRSPGPIPSWGAASAHSSSFRQATDTENAAMLPAMAVCGSPSSPAVITALGSMTSSAARTQEDVSTLSGTGMMVAMNSLVDCVVVEAPDELGLLLHGRWAARRRGLRASPLDPRRCRRAPSSDRLESTMRSVPSAGRGEGASVRCRGRCLRRSRDRRCRRYLESGVFGINAGGHGNAGWEQASPGSPASSPGRCSPAGLSG